MNIDLLFTEGTVLSTQLRLALALVASGVSALFFWEDFKDLMIPDWVPWICVTGIVGFWVFVTTGRISLGAVGVVLFFLLLYGLTKGFLDAVCYFTNVGNGDATYAGVLATLLPSPVLWASPLPYVPLTYRVALPLDFVVNVVFVFVVTGVVTKSYIRLKGEFGLVPFTPVVGVVFVTTVLFGAWWRPILMPAIKLAVEVLGGFL